MSNDPTAKIATNNVSNSANGDRRSNRRYLDIMTVINTICDLSLFEIEGDFTLRDKRSGEVWTSTKK
jgi:hypothetical protein